MIIHYYYSQCLHHSGNNISLIDIINITSHHLIMSYFVEGGVIAISTVGYLEKKGIPFRFSPNDSLKQAVEDHLKTRKRKDTPAFYKMSLMLRGYRAALLAKLLKNGIHEAFLGDGSDLTTALKESGWDFEEAYHYALAHTLSPNSFAIKGDVEVVITQRDQRWVDMYGIEFTSNDSLMSTSEEILRSWGRDRTHYLSKQRILLRTYKIELMKRLEEADIKGVSYRDRELMISLKVCDWDLDGAFQFLMNRVYTGPFVMWKEKRVLKEEIKVLRVEAAHIRAILDNEVESAKFSGLELKGQLQSVSSQFDIKRGRFFYLKDALDSVVADLMDRLRKKGVIVTRREAMNQLQSNCYSEDGFWNIEAAYERLLLR